VVIERVHEWVVGPEYKVTDMDGETGQIVGVSGGRVFEGVLFLAPAASGWSTPRATPTCGGLIVEWRQRTDHVLGYSFGTLAGFGSAEREFTVTTPVRINPRDEAATVAPALRHRHRRARSGPHLQPESPAISTPASLTERPCGCAPSLNGATATIRLQVGF
jgi:hypothetical protein